MSSKYILPFVCLLAQAMPLPVFFEPNRGQAAHGVDFIARQGNQVSLLSATEARLTLGNIPVKLRFVGASGSQGATALDRLEGVSSYLHGSDPRAWRTGIPQYGQVRYSGIYPGIDLVYHGLDGRLEYDLIVTPGADARRILVQYDGIEELKFDAGDAILVTKNGSIRQQRPVAYQLKDGNREPVSAAYRVAHNGRLRIELGPYDRGRELVIDPVLDYSTYFGGSGGVTLGDLKVDASGNVYIAGGAPPPFDPRATNPFTGTQFPRDVFVMKFSPSSNTILYFTSLGGDDWDEARSLALDSTGGVVVGGYTRSSNFPTKNPIQTRQPNAFFDDGFVFKLAPDGQTLVFSTYLGGSSQDNLWRVALDPLGNTYACGSTGSRDFPLQNGLPTRFSSPLQGDLAFLTKISPTGSLIYSGLHGGATGTTDARGCTVDNAGNAYLVGYTTAIDFPLRNPLPATQQGGSSASAWITKVATDGQSILYSSYLGGTGANFATQVAVDALGNATVAGFTGARDFPTRNAAQPSYGGGTLDGYVLKLNAAGSDLVYSTYLGGSGLEQVFGLALGADGSAFVGGQTDDASFPVRDSVQKYQAGTDTFVVHLSPAGDRLLYSSLMGGSGDESVSAIAVDPNGLAYVGGTTGSRDFPMMNAYQRNFPIAVGSPSRSMFLYRLSAGSLTPLSLQLSPNVLSFSSIVGDPPPDSQTLNVSVLNGGLPTPFTATASTSSGNWLTIAPSSGTAPKQLAVHTNPAGLTPGSYPGTVVVTPTGGTATLASVSLRVFATAAVPQSVSPGFIGVESGDTEVAISGSSFAPGATVSLNLSSIPIPLQTTVVNSTTIRTIMPALYLGVPRVIPLSITNPGAQPSASINVTVGVLIPVIGAGGVVNSAALQGFLIAPGELITIFGSNLGSAPGIGAQFDSAGMLPTSLGGVRVLFDGQAAPLLYVSATQINAVAPYHIAPQDFTQLQVELKGQSGAALKVPVGQAVPGVFTMTASGSGPGAVLNQDLSVNSSSQPAQRGSIVAIYATGAGLMDSPRQDGSLVTNLAHPLLHVSVLCDGHEAEVQYAGSAPGLVEGVLQVNARIPADTRSGSNIPILIRVGSASSQGGVTLAVQ